MQISWELLVSAVTVSALVAGGAMTYIRLTIMSLVRHELDGRDKELQQLLHEISDRFMPNALLAEKFEQVNRRLDSIERQTSPEVFDKLQALVSRLETSIRGER